MLIKYPITLNCKKTNIQKRIKANTGEGNERELIITLTDGDKKLNLYNRGLVAAIVGVKPDGTKFSNSAVIAEDSTIRYTLTTQNVATEGTVDCQVRILDSVDTGVLFSAKFSIEVEANLSNEEAEESSNEWTELIAALDQVYKQVTVYQGSGAPTGTDFENIKVSDFYYDTLNEDYYYCSEIRRSGGGTVIIEIIWKKLLNSIPDEYVKFSDYPTFLKAGVVKKGSGFEVDENGAAIGVEYGPETVPVLSGRTFMSKTTVLNLIDYLELVNETQLQEGLDEKQDNITAGNGIDITGTTISAKVRNLGDNALTNHQNGLYVSKYSLGFDTDLRQNLADTAASKALASKSYVDELMSGAVKRLVVQSLPVSDIDENTIYMVPKTTEETNNIYDEYMYINDEWELIGTTDVDLSNYYTKTETDTALANKQDTMSAGNGIDKNGNTISVDLDTGTDNALDFNNTKLRFSKYNIGHDSDFRSFLVDNYYANALASKSYVDGLMSGAIKRKVVQTLPISDIDENTIYMLPKTTAETNNIYDEYMYINNAWEFIGSTEVDLTNYVKNTDYATNSKGGVIKVGSNGFALDANKFPSASNWNYTQFLNVGNGAFIGKGTLEAVLNNDSRIKEPQYELIDTVEITEPIRQIVKTYDEGYDDIIIEVTNATGTNEKMIGVVLQNSASSYMISRDIQFFSDTQARKIIFNFTRLTESLYQTNWGQYANGQNILIDSNSTGSYSRKVKYVSVLISDTGSTMTAGTIKIYGRKRF